MKKGVAKQLRCWADMLDPPKASTEKRNHPAIKVESARRKAARKKSKRKNAGKKEGVT